MKVISIANNQSTLPHHKDCVIDSLKTLQGRLCASKIYDFQTHISRALFKTNAGKILPVYLIQGKGMVSLQTFKFMTDTGAKLDEFELIEMDWLEMGRKGRNFILGNSENNSDIEVYEYVLDEDKEDLALLGTFTLPRE